MTPIEIEDVLDLFPDSHSGDWIKIGQGWLYAKNGKNGVDMPLYIIGTRSHVQEILPGVLRIGFEGHFIEGWLANYQYILTEVLGYSPAEVSEYKQYILFANGFQRRRTASETWSSERQPNDQI